MTRRDPFPLSVNLLPAKSLGVLIASLSMGFLIIGLSPRAGWTQEKDRSAAEEELGEHGFVDSGMVKWLVD